MGRFPFIQPVERQRSICFQSPLMVQWMHRGGRDDWFTTFQFWGTE
jgi:hypothetical protein